MKMVLSSRLLLVAAAILVDCVPANRASSESNQRWRPECPIGFQLVQTREKPESYCIRLKPPETFSDKFSNCADNKFTYKLYKSLNFTKPKVRLWADFRTLYPGGTFIDWSYSDSTGDILTTTFEVPGDPGLDIDDDLCTVIEPYGNLTAVRCTDTYQRFCVVEPYDEFDESTEGCEELQSYFRFWSPRATCLRHMVGANGGNVRANWQQASDLCQKYGGTLLQRGWRYANHPLLGAAGSDVIMEPLGIIMMSEDKLSWLTEEDGNVEVPDSEWSFENEEFSPRTSLVALQQDAWRLVNHSFTFFSVVCERSIHLRTVGLNVSFNQDDRLTLSVNDSSVDEKKLWCFTDSNILYPSEVTVHRRDSSNDFSLRPLTDGYYWCINADSKDFRVSESNKELVIRDKTKVKNLYAIKIRAKKKYNLKNLDKMLSIWSAKLSDYISVRQAYVEQHGARALAGENATAVLEQFKRSNKSLLEQKKREVFVAVKFRRVYLDARTVLLHAAAAPPAPRLAALAPALWQDLELIYMRPAYYCMPYSKVPQLELGSWATIGCINYTCVGDFNEGVQLVETSVSDCVVTTAQPISANITISYSTTTPAPPSNTLSRDTNDIQTLDSSEEEFITSTEHQETVPPTTTVGVANFPTDESLLTESRMPTSTTPSTTTREYVTVTNELPTEYVTVTNELPTESYVETATGACDRPPCRPPTPPNVTTILPPTEVTTVDVPFEEQLQSVMDNLAHLLNDSAASVDLQDVNDAFDGIDELLEHTDEAEIPGEFLRLVEELGSRAELGGAAAAAAVRRNVALLLADASAAAPCRGLAIAARDTDYFTEDAFQILTEEPNATQLWSNSSEAVVHLPASVMSSGDVARRVSFVVFRNDRAFSATATTADTAATADTATAAAVRVNSRVLSVTVHNLTTFPDGETVEIHFSPITSEVENNMTRSCGFWQFNEDGSGQWSQEGCTFTHSEGSDTLDTCRCDHLTHFAEILVPSTNFSAGNELALEIISVIISITSLVGLFLIGLTAAMFRSWRREFSNKIWLQLCAAILILQISYLVVVFARFTTYTIGCMLVGAILHYSVLASFCWMLVAAIISYRRLVLVFTRDASHKLLKAAAFSWGAPFAVIGILLSVDPHAYAGHFDEESAGTVFCYPSGLGLYLSVDLPVCVMLLANWALFVLIVRSVFASRSIQRHGNSKEAMRCASVCCLLVFLFGLPWVFVFLSGNIVMSYLFNITATFQGFVLFIFFVVGNKKTRDLWLNKLKIKQSRKVPVTSSTYKSTGGGGGSGWRPGSGKQISIEANMSKPRSLASTDDSRFS